MDLIRAIRDLLGPFVDQTPFELTDFQPFDVDANLRFGALEYHGTLNEGWMSVLLGIYQHPARRTITAEMWLPDGSPRHLLGAGSDSGVLHRQVWVYGPQSDGDALVRSIGAEVTTWLQPFRAPVKRECE